MVIKAMMATIEFEYRRKFNNCLHNILLSHIILY